ncbi:hypothetical protein MN608_02672 [Microdochium nivale]|nr:hypothetical protein MN608_02672 [Microdochium nivale]
MGEMILPKGIVTNTSWIYDEVASHPIVPPEKIQKYWRVYTTTFTRLVDPTANRLENFWWHVWGSERRNLPGPVLARLFEEISNGPTFVKLRSTANRYEGPSQPPSPNVKGMVKTVQIESNVGNSPSITENAVGHDGYLPAQLEKRTDSSGKKSSSMQQPPVKPILKTVGAPPSTGPRLNARIISPVATPAASDSEGQESSGSTEMNTRANAKVADLSKAKLEKKRAGAAGPKKKGAKIVASTANRRRPAMPRRPSSQSSIGGSDTGSKEGGSVSSKISNSTRSIETIHEGKDTHSLDESVITKTSGKRPETSVDVDDAAAPAVKQVQSPLGRSFTSSEPRQKSATSASPTEQTVASGPPKRVSQPSARTRVASLGHEASIVPRPSLSGAPAMSRSRSDMGSPRPGLRDWNLKGRGIAQGLTSLSTVTTSSATAHGTIIEFDENLPANEAFANALGEMDDPILGIQRSGTGSSTSSRLVPTLPSSSPNVHLGRSKSQLTLLLERQSDDKRARR